MKFLKTIFYFLLFITYAEPSFADVVEPPKDLDLQSQHIIVTEEVQSEIPSIELRDFTQSQEILPYTYYYIDKNGAMNIESISSEVMVADFKLYNTFDLPHEQGLVWLRMSVEPFLSSSTDILLDLGDTLQGTVHVWFKPTNKNSFPAIALEKNTYSLKELQTGGEVYVAIEGIPSLWFTPLLCTEEEKLASFEAKYHPLLLGLLAILTLLCLIRTLFDRSNWRLWAVLFGLSAFFTNYLGIPITPQGAIVPTDLGALLAVALTLFSLVMIGNFRMDLPYNKKGMALIFLLFALIGIVLSLLPFISEYAWTVRYLELWQSYAMVLLLPILFLMFSGTSGSLGYFFVNLILFISLWLGLYGIGKGIQTSFWATVPLIGQILVMILFLFGKTSASSMRSTTVVKRRNKKIKGQASVYTPPTSGIEGSSAGIPMPLQEEERRKINGAVILQEKLNGEIIEQEPQKESIIPKAKEEIKPIDEPQKIDTITPLYANKEEEVKKSSEIWYESASFTNAQASAKLEQAFRDPLESFMREVFFLEEEIKNEANKERALKHLAKLLGVGKEISRLSGALPQLISDKYSEGTKEKREKKAFNLHDLLRQVYTKVRTEASSNKVALSWYRAPYIGKWFIGDDDALASLLYQLLSDSIRATEQGSVSLRVERDSKSTNCGRLTFMIADSGSGQPPEKRTTSLLSKVWELAAEHNGEFNIENSLSGIEYSFTLSFVALEDDGVTEKIITDAQIETQRRRVMLVSQNTNQRQLLTSRLDRLDCQVLEMMSLKDAYKQYTQLPVDIIVIDNSSNTEDTIEFIAEIRKHEGEEDYVPCLFVCLVEDKEQERLLLHSGSSYTLNSGVGRLAYRSLIEELLTMLETPEKLYASLYESAALEEKSRAIEEPAPESSSELNTEVVMEASIELATEIEAEVEVEQAPFLLKADEVEVTAKEGIQPLIMEESSLETKKEKTKYFPFFNKKKSEESLPDISLDDFNDSHFIAKNRVSEESVLNLPSVREKRVQKSEDFDLNTSFEKITEKPSKRESMQIMPVKEEDAFINLTEAMVTYEPKLDKKEQ